LAANLRNGAFCVLPWIESTVRTNNSHAYFCCHGDPIEHDQVEIARNKIWNGEKIDQCSSCYKLESNKIISPRLKESYDWLKHPDIKLYFDQETAPVPKIYTYDLRRSNKCNLSCICCFPDCSSLWQKELGLEVSKENDFEIDLENLHHAKRIYFAGGEPLIIDYYQEIFEYIVKNELPIEVVINTNLTSVSDKVFEQLAKIKDCLLTVSVDSYGSVNEYHRYPMSWDKFMTNLNRVREYGIKISFNTVLDSVSAFGADRLVELEDYALTWVIALLSKPLSLSLENIPTQYKTMAIERVSSLKQNKFYNTDIMFKNRIDSAIERISMPGDSFLLSNYIKQLDTRRKINHTNYLGINLYE
jgi:sulfatase maturation enzyme AslB (radical SAM superfamily)